MPRKGNHEDDSRRIARAIREVRKIRYSDAEWNAIVERAHACGQPPASYVRDVSLGVVPKSRRAQAAAGLVNELGRIGNTLVALRSQFGSNGADSMTERIAAVLDELLTAVRRLA
jgi:hypothetical protein